MKEKESKKNISAPQEQPKLTAAEIEAIRKKSDANIKVMDTMFADKVFVKVSDAFQSPTRNWQQMKDINVVPPGGYLVFTPKGLLCGVIRIEDVDGQTKMIKPVNGL